MGGQCKPQTAMTNDVRVVFSQHHINQFVRSLFPYEWLNGYALPFLEDLLNQAPFSLWSSWAEGREGNLDIHYGTCAGQRDASLGLQTKALNAKGAMPNILPQRDTPQSMFEACKSIASVHHLPFDDASVDADLQFAVEWTVLHRTQLRDSRDEIRKAFMELLRRCSNLTKRLRLFQPAHARGLPSVQLGVIPYLLLIMQWKDTSLAHAMVHGFSLLGDLPKTGVFQPVQEEDPALTREDLWGRAPEVLRWFEAQPLDDHASFLWDSCQEEIRKGWACPFMQKGDLNRRFPAGWAGVPTFAHVQPSGKLRRIDNARRGLQNSALRYTERMNMCTAFQPAAVTKALVCECLRQGLSQEQLCLDLIESGSEDISDAYRMLPVAECDLPANVVMVKHPHTHQVFFVIMSALLFGFSASVMQFARWSRFLEALTRRVFCLLWALYMDDSNVVDFASGKGTAQRLGRDVLTAMGVPLADHKRELMSCKSGFLGLEHDLERALSQGVCVFTAKETVRNKLRDLINACETCTTPAQASKIRGVAGFISMGMFGRVGRAAMRPLKQRQYTDKPPWSNSKSLNASYHFLLFLLDILTPREVHLFPRLDQVMVIATDAQADSAPTGGVVIWDRGATNCGFVRLTPFLATLGYAEGAACIAECEGAMVPLVLLSFSAIFRHRRVLWLLDNTASLHALVKGNSTNAVQDRTVALVHLLMYGLCCQFFFEYVPSGANFADEVSRDLDNSQWSTYVGGKRPQEFSAEQFAFLWQLTLPELWTELEQRWMTEKGTERHWVWESPLHLSPCRNPCKLGSHVLNIQRILVPCSQGLRLHVRFAEPKHATPN